jgi:L-ascorbate metabolism protein UlaG (beta-lactamase superfamily)
VLALATAAGIVTPASDASGGPAPPLTAYAALEQPVAPGATSGLRVVFMGTSTLLLTDGETQILVDGFFTRPSIAGMALWLMKPDRKRITAALDAGGVGSPAAVLVAHAHHDHALDAPDVGLLRRRPGTAAPILVGSESLKNIARGRGYPDDQIKPAPTITPYEFGKFKVRAFETGHSPTPLPAGETKRPLGRHAYVLSYRMGPNYAYVVDHGPVRILVYPSAYPPEGQERELVRGLAPDVIFLGVGKLGDASQDFVARYWAEVVLASRASLVIPIHWDDFTKPFEFTRPLDTRRPLKTPLKTLQWPLDDAREGLRRVVRMACASGVEVAFARPFTPMALMDRPPLPDPPANRPIPTSMTDVCRANTSSEEP